MSSLALLTCGALGKEVKAIVEGQGWDVDIYGIPAMYHLYPRKIVEAVDAKLAQIVPQYRQVVLVYGDCGTAGALDAVLERHGAVRLQGPHCYEMFAGDDFDQLVAERPGTFFLTDWLVRNFERAVVRGLGIDRYPELKPVYFQHYTDLIYLAQFREDRLEEKAREIADYLQLRLEVRQVGMGQLETRLAALVQAAP